MRYSKYCWLFVVALLSCDQDERLTVSELNEYIRDPEHGLTQKSESNGYTIEVMYKPTDSWVNQELGEKLATSEMISQLSNKYNPYYYFVVNISRDNTEALKVDGNFSEFSELVQVMSFRMDNYTNLTTSTQDTIPTADFSMDRTYGMSNATSILFVFDNRQIRDNEWIQFNLNEFGLGIGNQRFRFSLRDIQHVPKVKWQS